VPGPIVPFGDPARPSLFEEDPEEVEGPVLSALLNYWRSQQKGDAIPLAAGFSPRDVKAHLSWIVVIDALPDYADFRYRVIGSRVCDYFLADGTGKTVTEAFAGMDALGNSIKEVYRRTCMLGRPTRSTGPATIVDGIYFPNYDSLYLPYSKNGVTADRVINAFSFSYDQMRARHAFASSTARGADKPEHNVPTRG
jgi:hypothetical protein